jgi:hypothetical protein
LLLRSPALEEAERWIASRPRKNQWIKNESTATARMGHVGRNQKVPINLWQCEKPIRAGVLLKTCKGCDAAITPPKRLISEVDMKLVSLIAFLLAASPVAAQPPGTSTSQTCTQDPHVLQRHRCVDEHDDGQWNERLGVERRFEWRRFGWWHFERRSGCRGTGDSQCPLRRRFPHGCLG